MITSERTEKSIICIHDKNWFRYPIQTNSTQTVCGRLLSVNCISTAMTALELEYELKD